MIDELRRIARRLHELSDEAEQDETRDAIDDASEGIERALASLVDAKEEE